MIAIDLTIIFQWYTGPITIRHVGSFLTRDPANQFIMPGIKSLAPLKATASTSIDS